MIRQALHLLLTVSLVLSGSVIVQAASYTFVPIDLPGGVFGTVPVGINNEDDIVGWWTDSNVATAFVLQDGAYRSIRPPDAFMSLASGINNKGQIVGSYEDIGGMVHGFLLEGGVFSLIDVPGAQRTGATGINKRGQIVGYYSEVNSLATRGFLLENGIFRLIDVPGASFTSPLGINSRGKILVASDGHSFLLQGGIFSPIDIDFDVPDPSNVGVSGMNDFGHIVGTYGDPINFTTHGFLTIPRKK